MTVIWLLTKPDFDNGLGISFSINFAIDWLLIDPGIICLAYYIA